MWEMRKAKKILIGKHDKKRPPEKIILGRIL
jgi:hypothetical protein